MVGRNSKMWRLIKLIAVIAVVTGLTTATWSISGYEPLWRLKSPPMMPLAFTPQGDVLATGELVQDGPGLKLVGPIRFFSSNNGTEVESPLVTVPAPPAESPAIPREILLAEFSPDGNLLTVLQEQHDINRDDLELTVFVRKTRERLINVAIPYNRLAADKDNTFPRTLFSPDSKKLLCVESPFPERSVRVWDLESGQQSYTLSKVCYPVFSPDSTTIATTQYFRTRGDEPFAVQLWDVRTGAIQKTIPLQGNSEGWSPWPSFSPDGNLIAVNSRDNSGKQTVEVFETASGKRVFQREAWSPHLLSDGRTLLTVENQNVQFWDTESWTLSETIRFQMGMHSATGDELSPEPLLISGKPMVAVFDDYPATSSPSLQWLGKNAKLNAFGSQRMILIDGTSAQRQSVVFQDDSFLRSPVWSPEGTVMAMGSVDGTLSVWAVPPHKSFFPLICALAFVVMAGAAGLGIRLLYRRKATVKKPQVV